MRTAVPTVPFDQLPLADLQAIDGRIDDQVFAVLPAAASAASRTSYGGTAPANVAAATATATFAQAVEWMSEGIKSGPPLQDPDQAIGNATLGMAAKWPAT